MTDWLVPSDREQLQFLKNIQRLLNEGSFVASYKFALLHSLADLAVLKGDDSGAPLEMSTRQIAERLDFLYTNTEEGSFIELKPGVAYCLRAFYPVLCGLFRSGWIDYLRKSNARDLGYTMDLQEFLFGQERMALDLYKPLLRDVQRGTCFYCREELRSAADVDHFIPWSRCHSDLAHNFVLAHRGCNSAKSDHLAFEKHLEAWAVRNTDLRTELDQEFDALAVVHDLGASARIARWAYS